MSNKAPSEFPDLENKLQKPVTLSAFERQRAEAEAKRAQRNEAETAAVYEDFVKSFDRDDDYDTHNQGAFPPPRPRPGPPRGGMAATGASKRHFGTSGLKSGPGSLGPPPTTFGTKRSYQDYSRPSNERKTQAFERFDGGRAPVTKVFNNSDDEDAEAAIDRIEEKARAKPTLVLSDLPPGTSPAMIKSFMPANLNIENVKIQPPARGGTERKCATATVTLTQDTPLADLNDAVTALQRRYLGFGYYLSLHRGLSSAVAHSSAPPNLVSSSSSAHPFGAKPVEMPSGSTASNHHHHHGPHHRGFAPPSSYGPAGGVNRSTLLHVPVKPPRDIKTIRAINKVIERVLEHGPEFEALLMSRPEVQREERWAWIWDARSEGGIWYRWKLWEIVTGAEVKRKKGKYVPLFDGGHAWKCPEKSLQHEYVTELNEFVSDSEYNSSDDEDYEEANRDNQSKEDERNFLDPLAKAKLMHLLARLPTTLGRLRKGDIARVTAFAITNCSHGAEEVVDLIVSNVEKPFSLMKGGDKKTGSTNEATSNDNVDVSAASLIALYVVNDVLAASSTSGVRHAWRFRQLFENALRDRKVFERLGSMAEKLAWGRLRADRWKKSVGQILELWEGACVFPVESQELFVKSFENPPSAKIEPKAGSEGPKQGKWKVVEASRSGNDTVETDATKRPSALPISISTGPEPSTSEEIVGEPIEEDDVEGEPIDEDDIEGEPIDEDDVEGEPIDEDDVEGESIQEADVQGDPVEAKDVMGGPAPQAVNEEKDRAEGGEEASQGRSLEAKGRGHPRKRMRAVDMFADNDGSEA